MAAMRQLGRPSGFVHVSLFEKNMMNADDEERSSRKLTSKAQTASPDRADRPAGSDLCSAGLRLFSWRYSALCGLDLAVQGTRYTGLTFSIGVAGADGPPLIAG